MRGYYYGCIVYVEIVFRELLRVYVVIGFCLLVVW